MSENNENSTDSNICGDSETVTATETLPVTVAATAVHVNQNIPTTTVVNNPLIRAGVLRPSLLTSSRYSSDSSNRSRLSNADDTKNSNSNSITHHASVDRRESNEVQTNPFLLNHKNDNVNDNDSTDADTAADNDDNDTLAKDADANTHPDANADAKQNKLNLNSEQHTPSAGITLFRKNGLDGVNLFAAAKSTLPLGKGCDFVFGENVHERVVGDNIKLDSSSNDASMNIPNSSTISSAELLFSSVAKNANKTMSIGQSGENNSTNALGTKEATTVKTLSDVAREYEEKRAQKRKFEEMQTFTGEEDEINIIDINCKLFAFVNSNWEERGRGSLRLNDFNVPKYCSRLVFRTSGNLRLLLNTKVWAGMVAEQPSQKSMRLTAMDNTGKIKIFLVMARPRDISELYQTLTKRIRRRALTHPNELSAIDDCNATDEKKNSDQDVDEENVTNIKIPVIQPDLINSAQAVDTVASPSNHKKLLERTASADQLEATIETSN